MKKCQCKNFLHAWDRYNPGIDKKKKNRHIAFVAGKSGGHIVPCLTLAKKYLQEDADLDVTFFTTAGALDHKIISQSQIVERHIPLSLEARPNKIWGYPYAIFQFVSSFFNALNEFSTHPPHTLITTGGIVSIPACLAAYVLNIPVHLYVLDAFPGKALCSLERFATQIHCCFDSALHYFSSKGTQSIAYPIRYDKKILSQSKQAARLQLGLDDKRKTIVVLGGSQGSSFLNHLIKDWIHSHPQFHNQIQIIHQYGNDYATNWKAFYQELHFPIRIFDYRADLGSVYAAADIIIARAGAGTIFETLAFDKSCLLIPLETASTDHQYDNAKSITKKYPRQFNMLRQSAIEKDKDLFYVTFNDMLLGDKDDA
jgi:UDP-N-acetylglucosamine--N-acetylmuramyl-(pentapeptide) pyrophosphoryl-undecaprenol N-acetylglucosamine transferase